MIKLELSEWITTETKYLIFRKGKYSHKKTFDIDISSKDDFLLGSIQWRSGWRRYVFYPEGETVFDVNCLYDICSYIEDLMEERKK